MPKNMTCCAATDAKFEWWYANRPYDEWRFHCTKCGELLNVWQMVPILLTQLGKIEMPIIFYRNNEKQSVTI